MNTQVLSLCLSALAILLSVLLNLKKSTQEDSTQITTVIVKLENIQAIVTETKADIRSIKDDIKELDHRVTVVEQSTKSAHHRIDAVEARTGTENENTQN